MSIAELLQDKGVLKITKEVRVRLKPTQTGLNCIDLGLPEERLLKELIAKEGKLNIEDLAPLQIFKEPNELNVAVGEARKQGWIRIHRVGPTTTVELVEQEPEYELGRVLREISRSLPSREEIGKDTRAQLIRRGLVAEEESVGLLLSLDEIGKGIAEGKIGILEEITTLSRELLESGRWKKAKIKSYDVTASPPKAFPGKLQPYAEFLDEVREILVGMGFEEVKGPYVEAEFWNFDALFQPQDHPAREIHSSYVLSVPKQAEIRDLDLVSRVKEVHETGCNTGSSGWRYKWSFDVARRLVLRTQTTAVSIRTIAKRQELPLKIFSIDHVFRPDVLDRVHSMDFLQCEGVVMAEDLNTRHMLGFLASLAMELGFKKEEIRFKPGYFPFTEPSAEAHVKHKRLGWVEALGAGMFRPEVLAPCGFDAETIGALAWGIGIGRLAMARLGIGDIRELHSKDLAWLREFKGRR